MKDKKTDKDRKKITKKQVFITALVILSILGIVLGSFYIKIPYTTILSVKFGITIPKSNNLLYEKEVSDTGEIIKYHVFKYDSNSKLESDIAWSTKQIFTRQYENYNDVAEHSFELLNIDEKYKINYQDCKYKYVKNKESKGELFLFYNTKENILYILESYIEKTK